MNELLKTIENKNSDIIKKWENHGFLSSATNKRNVALACELSALYMLDDKNKYVGEITILTHPTMIRIFRKTETDLPIKIIFDNVVEIIEELSVKLTKIQTTDVWINRDSEFNQDGSVNSVDVVAEFICEFCNDYNLNLE